jgi:hypothetical protein
MSAPALHYSRVARLLHWVIALLIVANILIGIAHATVNKDWPVIPLHKSIGLTVLALTVLRILWRDAPPAAAARADARLGKGRGAWAACCVLRSDAGFAPDRLGDELGGPVPAALVQPLRRAEIRGDQGDAWSSFRAGRMG